MRRLRFILLGVIIIISLWFVSYSRTYTITNDRAQLEKNILRFINRPYVAAKTIDIKQELNLDNKKYVVFIINNSLGDAELTKGFNNKYKIKFTRYGNGFFRDDINKTNKGKYIILKGKNPDNKIAYCKAKLDKREYKIVIPKQEYFMVYCKVPSETQRIYLEANSVKFYNSEDVDITESMFKIL